MRVVLAGGGTGGHVYPGLAVARALQAELASGGEPLEMLYIGVRGRMDEEIVPRAGLRFRSVSAGPLRVASPFAFARNALRLVWGTLQSARILLPFRPQAVFATGGYASVPVGIAARLLRRPLVVYLPDVTPGWAVRLLARLATRMATTSERALLVLPRAKTTVVGYPVREAFWTNDRVASRAALGLPADARVLLVTGASQGSQRLNDAVFAALPAFLDRCHVLHLTGAAGEADAVAQRARLSPDAQSRYHVRGYLDEMAAAMHAADLAICRAGASTLGELPAAALPAVLVPGEYEGWSQAPNAEFLQAQGAAVVLREAELDRLGEVTTALLDDPARLERMRQAMRMLARPEAALDIARLLVAVAR